MSYSEPDGSVLLDGERYHRIGGPPPPPPPLRAVARTGQFIYQQRPANPGALAAMSDALTARAASERWTAAGLLARFRNWRNRR